MAAIITDDIGLALEEVCLPMVEKVVESLTPSNWNKLQTMAEDSYTVCIYRVSEKHRKINEEAYTPRSVSIGPIHRGKRQLQAMESYKLSCLKTFVDRTGTTVETLIRFAAKEESCARGCYEDTGLIISSENFSEMILLDGVFILELLMKGLFKQMTESSDGGHVDNKWMADDVLHAMLLLENQLPMNFLIRLFKFVEASSWLDNMSSFQLAGEYFKNVGNMGRLKLRDKCWLDKCLHARHFVEFLVYLHQPYREIHVAHPHFGRFEYTRSASELQEAGVKFTPREVICLFDVSFITAVGVLEIPPLILNDFSETFFRNLIAFEESGHYSQNITSYIIFMDSLINTSDDVDLLVKNGIIMNMLGESEQVADLFNNIYKEVVPDQRQFYFAQILW